jgi:undecaprenyl-diphosphatase
MEFILDLADPWGYLVIGLLAAAEASVFVGLFLPGEASMLIGGVLVYHGRASLGVMLVAACLGAIIGDSIGYEIGRRYGDRLRGSRLGRRIGEHRWDRALAYVKDKGGRAVFFGRFVGVLRALVPAVAGSAGMPYRTFAIFNVAGGIIWAGGFVLLGVAAGGSYALVEKWAGRASLVLLLIVLVAIGLVAIARWLREHLDLLRAKRDDLLARPGVARLRTRYSRQIAFLERRLDPSQRLGLYLTVGVFVAIAGASAFGAVLEDVLDREELAVIDRPVVRFMALHREQTLTDVMKVVTMVGGTSLVAAVLGVAAVVSYVKTRRIMWPLFMVTTAAGGLGLDDVVKWLVGRPRPNFRPVIEATGWAFPSGHATAAAALCGALAYLLTRNRPWRDSVWIWTAALFVSLMVGLSRVYLGVHWPTDVLGGLLLGGFWTAVTATATSLLRDAATRRSRVHSTEATRGAARNMSRE